VLGKTLSVGVESEMHVLAGRQRQVWAILGLVLLGAVLSVLVALPRHEPQPVAAAQPSASPPTEEDIVTTILSYVDSERPDDPLIQVDDGVWVKRSNYQGVTIGSVVYYYALLPHASFDPLSRGAVSADQVQIIRILDDPGFRILIYTITGPLGNVKREA